MYYDINLDKIRGVTTDSNGDIICIGTVRSEESDTKYPLIVKFDTNLNVLAKMICDTGDDWFNKVTTDANDNIILAGCALSEEISGIDALVVKYDPNLNILARKTYGDGGEEFNQVTTDSSGNVICVGWTNSERIGTNADALVVKFDNDLNIITSNTYDDTDIDWFYGVAIDSNNNIICVGHTSSGSTSGADCYDALVVKYDTNLNMLADTIYSGIGNDWFDAVITDSSGNVICIGCTDSGSTSAAGNYDMLVSKYDADLNVLDSNTYGDTSSDELYAVATNHNGDIVCVGDTLSDSTSGPSNYVIRVVKFTS